MGQAFIICGSPGSGKSVYGKALAEKRGAVLLDIDFSTERLIRLSLAESGYDPDDRDSAYFKKTFRQPIYDTLFDIARQNLSWIDVIIVGPYTREIRKERLIRRGNQRDMLKLQDWDNHLKYYGDEKPPEFPHVFIDTSDKK